MSVEGKYKTMIALSVYNTISSLERSLRPKLTTLDTSESRVAMHRSCSCNSARIFDFFPSEFHCVMLLIILVLDTIT